MFLATFTFRVQLHEITPVGQAHTVGDLGDWPRKTEFRPAERFGLPLFEIGQPQVFKAPSWGGSHQEALILGKIWHDLGREQNNASDNERLGKPLLPEGPGPLRSTFGFGSRGLTLPTTAHWGELFVFEMGG